MVAKLASHFTENGNDNKKTMTATDVVYFADDPRGDNWIYIGWTTKETRERAHNSVGREILAWVRGDDHDEKRLQKDLKALAVPKTECGNESTYDGSELYDYISWLLKRGYAYAERESALKSPLLPYEQWAFSRRDKVYEDKDGQLHLSAIPMRPVDRLRFECIINRTKSSLSDDWFTPPHVIELARRAMGSIDTDPATCAEANEYIEATIWYTKALNGLLKEHPWKGNVWLNPPYGRGDNSAKNFIARLEQEYLSRRVKQAITCLNLDSMSSLWFQPVLRVATIHLIWRGRLNFVPPKESNNGEEIQTGGASPTKGTIISYFGADSTTFKAAFRQYGSLITVLN